MISNLSNVGKVVYTMIAVILSAVANALGGFDSALRLLIVLIVADYVTGIAAAIKL